jgi:hypothetical protein
LSTSLKTGCMSSIAAAQQDSGCERLHPGGTAMSMHLIIPRLLQGRTSGKIRTLLSIIFMIAGCPAWADIYQSEEVFLNQDLINIGVPNDTPLAFSPDTHLCVLSRYYGLGLGGGQVYIGKDNLWHLKLLAKDAHYLHDALKHRCLPIRGVTSIGSRTTSR